jgi:protein-L-isoaspartate(D-aspartate) O-methyltransferase
MSILRSTLIVFCLFPLYTEIVRANDDYSTARQQMVEHINKVAQKTERYTDRSAFDPRLMQVIGDIPRHLFVPQEQVENAYTNRPLPIGYGQTISEPYVVALMTELLQTQPDHKVLEIGTVSGYQAAVLSQLVNHVYSIEIIDPLGSATTRLLNKLGYDNIDTRIADGYNGWPEQAPFDGIIVTAAISHIPPPLVAQLKNGGVMVIPVGTRFQTQQLTLVKKDMQGRVTTKQILPVRFVAFTGGH